MRYLILSTHAGVEQWPYAAVGVALEVIPRTLAQNCGANVIRVLTKLRAKHAEAENSTFGINGHTGDIVDMQELGVWEPYAVKVPLPPRPTAVAHPHRPLPPGNAHTLLVSPFYGASVRTCAAHACVGAALQAHFTRHDFLLNTCLPAFTLAALSLAKINHNNFMPARHHVSTEAFHPSVGFDQEECVTDGIE